ncbi:aminoglycoside phosphotransferase family protein [Streptomyces sp. RFCAC02]|uniref:aminoglycoside phosphotransferase family protein n=1 Tax=Streptomyces sp. RFCAC02 TaxID=2499143 RepID=UPI001020E5C6|nr:aminoglycoside phosphotransferase family protein [Streptomyces sp. RFCAC02]
MEFAPPEHLVRAQRATAPGWLDDLPALAARTAERWRLTPERVIAPGGRTSMTVLVRTADGVPAVLKLTAPGRSAPLEDAALRTWDGLGAVRPLRLDADAGALLLERLSPATSLRSLADAKATLEAVSVLRRLWVAPVAGHPFPDVAELTGAQTELMRSAVPHEAAPLVEAALTARAGLLAGAPEAVLLHGDFRQGAVLAAATDRAHWLAVGPDPLVGERAYDLARLVRDRLHDLVASPGAAAATRRRVTRLAGSVELDPERLRGWALFRAVAAAARAYAAKRDGAAEHLLEFATWL